MPVHRKNNIVKLLWNKEGREKIKAGKKKDKMKENSLEFKVN